MVRVTLAFASFALATVAVAKPEVVVYVFIKGGCPHTKAALPGLNQLANDLKGKATLRVLASDAQNSSEAQKKLDQLRKEMSKNWAKVSDPDGSGSRKLGAKHSLDILVVQGKERVLLEGFGPKAIAEISRRTGVKLKNKAYPTKRLSGCGI